jgi:hypothetical protein
VHTLTQHVDAIKGDPRWAEGVLAPRLTLA